MKNFHPIREFEWDGIAFFKGERPGAKQDKANWTRRVEARSLFLIVAYIGEFIT